MHFVRYEVPSGETLIGCLHGDRLTKLPFPSMESMLTSTIEAIRQIARDADEVEERPYTLRAPVDGRTEVWASGVTYRRSMDARVEESHDEDVYQRVYEADRPELFFKANAWRTVTDGQLVGVRADSDSDVPEPELAIALNAQGEIVGYLVCNDMTSRAIESQNPIYLPQAKMYAGACALSTGIRPAWEIDSGDLVIDMQIVRSRREVFAGRTSTAQMRRRFDELIEWLFAADQYPYGVVLSTGTGIVPPLDFTLEDDDIVTIDIPGVGSLRNTVARGVRPFLTEPQQKEEAHR